MLWPPPSILYSSDEAAKKRIVHALQPRTWEDVGKLQITRSKVQLGRSDDGMARSRDRLPVDTLQHEAKDDLR